MGGGRAAAEHPTALAGAPQRNHLAQTSEVVTLRNPGLRWRGPFCLSGKGELAVAQGVLLVRQVGLLLPRSLLEDDPEVPAVTRFTLCPL